MKGDEYVPTDPKDPDFRALVDRMAKDAKKNKSLREGLDYIEKLAERWHCNFYEATAIFMRDHANQQRARDWLHNRKLT